jgi:hypothetical protein
VASDVASEHPGSVDGPHLYRWRDMSHPVDSLLIRFRGDAMTASARVREATRQLDPDDQAWPRTLRTILDETAERFSTMVRMVGVLAGLALSLAILGIYGVVAFTVSQRTKELGIRMALGATKSAVVGSVLALVGFAAMLRPAWRAATADPIPCLRCATSNPVGVLFH